MGELKGSIDRIQDEHSRLLQQWHLVADDWRDAARFRFQKEFWDEYQPVIQGTLRRLESLDQLLEVARREVP